MADRDDHVLALDQGLDIGLELDILDRRAARIGELLLDLQQLVAQDLDKALARAQDFEMAADLGDQLLQFVGDLVALEPRQALQPEIEDRARLLVGELVGAVRGNAPALRLDPCQQWRDIIGRPAPPDEAGTSGGGIGRGADQRDDLVDVGDRDEEADQGMRPLARLIQEIGGAAGDDLFAEGDKGHDDVAQGQLFGAAGVDRQHVDAKAGLQRRVAEQLVQNDVGIGVALQFDDEPHAVAIALVAQFGDALNELFMDAFGNALLQPCLVDLVRHLGEDERLAAAAHFLDMALGADDDGAAAGLVGGMRARAADDDAAGREVRRRHELHQLVDRDVAIVEIGAAGVDHLTQIVRRDVGRHADRDTLRAIDQQVRKAGRQDLGLALGLVVIRLELDGVLVEIVEQGLGDPREARLGVPVGGRRIAVHRAEIALAVDQRQAHREVLRQPHHRVVDREIAVRMVFAHHVADDAGGFAVAAVPQIAVCLHRIEDAAMHRLQPVADVGERPRHDHAHRVIEVGAAHLLFDRDGRDLGRGRRCCGNGQGGLTALFLNQDCGRAGVCQTGAAPPRIYSHRGAKLPVFAAAK